MYLQHIELERVQSYNLKNIIKRNLASRAWSFILIKVIAI